MLVTEDSGSGYQFFSRATRIPVQSARIKTCVNRVLRGLINQRHDHILLIVDGAAFGPEIEGVMQIIDSASVNVAIYLPESFEWFVLHSKIFEYDATIQNQLNNYLSLIDYSECFSVEQYFTTIMRKASLTLGYTYDKSANSLPESFFTRENTEHLLYLIPNVDFGIEQLKTNYFT